jgi:hypothetical protein
MQARWMQFKKKGGGGKFFSTSKTFWQTLKKKVIEEKVRDLPNNKGAGTVSTVIWSPKIN